MIDADQFLERGHFVGKTGGHIDAKLKKERFFNNPEAFHLAIRHLLERLSANTPDVLVSQEVHGAIIANSVGNELNVPVIVFAKDGTPHTKPNLIGTNAVIIEDNIVTGDSVRELLKGSDELGLQVVNILSVFSSASNSSGVDFNYESLIDLGINTRSHAECMICEG